MERVWHDQGIALHQSSSLRLLAPDGWQFLDAKLRVFVPGLCSVGHFLSGVEVLQQQNSNYSHFIEEIVMICPDLHFTLY